MDRGGGGCPVRSLMGVPAPIPVWAPRGRYREVSTGPAPSGSHRRSRGGGVHRARDGPRGAWPYRRGVWSYREGCGLTGAGGAGRRARSRAEQSGGSSPGSGTGTGTGGGGESGAEPSRARSPEGGGAGGGVPVPVPVPGSPGAGPGQSGRSVLPSPGPAAAASVRLRAGPARCGGPWVPGGEVMPGGQVMPGGGGEAMPACPGVGARCNPGEVIPAGDLAGAVGDPPPPAPPGRVWGRSMGSPHPAWSPWLGTATRVLGHGSPGGDAPGTVFPYQKASALRCKSWRESHGHPVAACGDAPGCRGMLGPPRGVCAL